MAKVTVSLIKADILLKDAVKDRAIEGIEIIY